MTKLCFTLLFALILLNSLFSQENFAVKPSQKSTLNEELFINEFMTCNAVAYGNSDGDYEDWIEIFNSSNAAIDLAGYYLTDDLKATQYWKILSTQAQNTTIPAKGFLLLYADEKPEKGANHLGFKLNQQGEKIFLLYKDGITILDSITYPVQFRDVSYSRITDSSNK
jgi:hypothetical protein